MTTSFARFLGVIFILALAGCGGSSSGSGTDGGGTPTDSGTMSDGGGTTTDGGTMSDGGGTMTDSGTVTDSGTTTDGGNVTDGGTTTDGGGTTDGGTASCAGMECGGYQSVLSSQPRDATNLTSCVIQLHQLDCCGAMAAYGVNHAARTALCAAETTCVASYPASPGCSDATITTDTGDTTTVMANVKVRRTSSGQCQTFVCTDASCSSAPGIEGGCG